MGKCGNILKIKILKTMTTTTNNQRQKLQPKPLDTIALRQVLGSWKRAGLSYAQIYKLQKLYLGETGWMDLQGVYPRNNFYEIAMGLKFKSISEMITCAKRCKGFGFVWMGKLHDKIDALSGIFSELWYEPSKDEEITYPEVFRRDNNNININNNISSNNKYINGGTPPSAEQVYSEFLLYLVSDQGAYDGIVKPINEQTERMMPELRVEQSGQQVQPGGASGLQVDASAQQVGASAQQVDASVQPNLRPVNAATELFLRKYLGQYMVSQGRKFVNGTHVGRKIWVQNLMRYPFMQRNVANAVADIRAQMQNDALVIARTYHPLSKFEFTERNSGRRFYDRPDGQGKTTVELIPQEAPPRPSALALWDRFGKEWYQAG